MTETRLNRAELGWAIFLTVLLLFLAFYNLRYFPPTWFDEGIHSLAAKRLALTGDYRLGPALGPTVLLPVAGAFRVAGVALIPARLVMVGYLLLCTFAFYLVARRLGGWKVAVVATLLLIGSPGANLLRWGRQVLGEVPATFFLLMALLVWFRVADVGRSPRRWAMIGLAGALTGLAILTKNQFLLLLPAWAIVWLVDRWVHRRFETWEPVVVMGVALLGVLGWYALQGLVFPGGDRLMEQNVREWSGALNRGLFTLSFRRMMDAVRFVTDKEAFYGLMLPGVLYGALLSLRSSSRSARWTLVTIASVVWLGWFLLLSAAWPRYAFLPLVFGAICVAQLFHDLTDGFELSIRRLWASLRSGEWDPTLAGRAALILLLVVMTGRYLYGRLSEVVAQDDAPQQMAAYVVEHVPPDAEIETYDPEICFLAGHSCHLPGSQAMDAAIKYVWYDGTVPSAYHDFASYGAPYLLIGDFSRLVDMYDEEVVVREYDLLVTIGGYELYVRK